MCGRYNSHFEEMHGWTNLFEKWPDVDQSYNIAPASKVTAFRSGSGEVMRWGLIPSWAESFESAYSTFNARVETVHEKPAFRDAWKNAQRCLIPMAGYYEWKGEKGSKQPYYVTDRLAGGLVAAGLYDSWKLGRFLSCTILTKPADEAMSKLHPRVPLLLTPESALDWMSCSDDLDQDKVGKIARPKLSFYEVGKIVGNTDVDNPHLIEPKRL